MVHLSEKAGILTCSPVANVFPTISVTSCSLHEWLLTAAGQLGTFTPFPDQFGCKSTKKREKRKEKSEKFATAMFFLYLSPLEKVGCTSEMKINRNLFCISLGLHYL
jgi:hypothetical protein